MVTPDWLVRVGILELLDSLETVDIQELSGSVVIRGLLVTPVISAFRVIRGILESADIPEFQAYLVIKVSRASLGIKALLGTLGTLDIVENLDIRVSKDSLDTVDISVFLDTLAWRERVDIPEWREHTQLQAILE